jgi:hypothetical protein
MYNDLQELKSATLWDKNRILHVLNFATLGNRKNPTTTIL